MTARVAFWLALGGALLAQDRPPALLRELVGDASADGEARAAAVAALQTAGQLDGETLLLALGAADDGVAMTAAAIVRHEWPTLPPDVLEKLLAAPERAEPLLRELAVAPRPALAPFVQRWLAASGRSADQRCLGLAALGAIRTAAEAEPLLAALRSGTTDDGYHLALGVLAPAAADGLLAKVHGLLVAGKVELSMVLPWFERLSPAGRDRLLGLVVTLPPAVADGLCAWLAQGDVPEYRARCAAALAGQIPLEPHWLWRVGPLLDEPAQARLAAVVADEQAATALRQRAFECLVGKGALPPAVLAFTATDGPERLGRIRTVLDGAVAEVPAARLLEWLGDGPELARLVARALPRRRQLEAPLVQALLDGCLEIDGAIGEFPDLAARVLVQRGDEATVQALWPRLRGVRRSANYIEVLARRREPFVPALLLAELQAAAGDPELAAYRDELRLGLCLHGDRREAVTLARGAATQEPLFVRRAAAYAGPLPVAAALRLLDDAAAAADDDLAAELTLWAAATDAPAVRARLLAAWQAPDGGERTAAALRAVVAGPHRQELQERVTRALAAGPLGDADEALAFEVVAELPQPLAAADLRWLADLALRPGGDDPAAEAARAARWPDGRFGFPLVGAIAQRLRGSEPPAVGAAFAAVVADWSAAVAPPLCRQRLLVLWRSLEVDRELLTAVGTATAPLLLRLPGPDGLGEGPAHYFAWLAAVAAADHAGAAAHARAAVAGLLRLPAERRSARLFLGERDPASGSDPWAALAAAPHLAAARVARAAGDAAALRAALTAAAEFAGRDAATVATIVSLDPESSR